MTRSSFDSINDEAREAYATEGAICLHGAFIDWVELLRAGVEHNHNEPAPYFSDNVTADESCHNIGDAQRPREDWFPVLWPRPGSQELAHG